MKKILILSAYSGIYRRGVENWADNFKEKLKNEVLIEIKSFTTEKIKFSENKHNHNWLNRFFLDYKSLKIFKFTLSTIKHLKGYDIIIPTNGGWQSVIVKVCQVIYRYKIIIFSHSGIGWDERINLYTFPDLFVCLNNKIFNWARNTNPFVKKVNIPVPVDTDRFNPIGKKAVVKLPSPIILCVGAAVPTKQIDLTIKAISKTKASLMLVSKGPLSDHFDDIAQSLIGYDRYTRVEESSPEIYRSCDVFTLAPWENESSPVVFLEAMASNLPIVTTNDPARKETIGDAGFYINPHNIESYAKAIISATKKNWGKTPRNKSLDYSWHKIGKIYLDKLSKV